MQLALASLLQKSVILPLTMQYCGEVAQYLHDIVAEVKKFQCGLLAASGILYIYIFVYSRNLSPKSRLDHHICLHCHLTPLGSNHSLCRMNLPEANLPGIQLRVIYSTFA